MLVETDFNALVNVRRRNLSIWAEASERDVQKVKPLWLGLLFSFEHCPNCDSRRIANGKYYTEGSIISSNSCNKKQGVHEPINVCQRQKDRQNNFLRTLLSIFFSINKS